MTERALAASFRDPSGFVFRHAGTLYRQVNQSYAPEYDCLMASGLYQNLVEAGLLIPHEEVSLDLASNGSAFKVLRPVPVPFISYPYEWSFGQLKDAALATLRIQRRALRHGMTLKDCSAYNVQFYNGKPILIDTLSFERYQEGQPWVAYRQFCQHFLAPLALMSYGDVRLGQLLRVYIDGIPLDLASGLLPWRTYLVPSLLLHIHLHARSQRRYSAAAARVSLPGSGFSQRAFLGLLDGLKSAVHRLHWSPEKTSWAAYYADLHEYSDEAGRHKREVVTALLERVQPATLWDFGANTGLYSRIASERGISTLAFDFDPGCVELSYRAAGEHGDANLLPLVLDLTNPSPGIGWAHTERASLMERGPAGMVLALALIHHLAIANNVPLARIAEFFAAAGESLVVEFVPKSDSQVQKLLAHRRDIFDDYNQHCFEQAFVAFFTIEDKVRLRSSDRWIYLMRSSHARPVPHEA
ncbi:MAG TPA: hypothetical protein VER55_07395 [Ardenticatenaceae bacterium]|nr:hypothetical protein [Ardenticatenaceae bacterium]